MRPGPLTQNLPLTVAEVVEVEAAARRLREEGLPDRAATLRDAANKLRAMMDATALRRTETDVEVLLASEGLAARPGPKVKVEPGVIEVLRNALLANHRISLTYRGSGGDRTHLLEPCGLLYGQRPYLLAVKPGKPDAAVWRLDRIVEVTPTNEAFEARPGFDLKTLAAQCFGVWREAPMDVALRFTGNAAIEAADWLFHASQTLEPQADGALVVRFRAGGIEEMAAHLAS
jgi:predicted DNA-binding transcriptional regulator YafY